LFIYLRSEDETLETAIPTPAIPTITSSQKVTSLFFVVAMALFLVQIGAGMITAHYLDASHLNL
jgi:nitric oxide reductase subunit B